VHWEPSRFGQRPAAQRRSVRPRITMKRAGQLPRKISLPLFVAFPASLFLLAHETFFIDNTFRGVELFFVAFIPGCALGFAFQKLILRQPSIGGAPRREVIAATAIIVLMSGCLVAVSASLTNRVSRRARNSSSLLSRRAGLHSVVAPLTMSSFPGKGGESGSMSQERPSGQGCRKPAPFQSTSGPAGWAIPLSPGSSNSLVRGLTRRCS
jgi:hypothetical protein